MVNLSLGIASALLLILYAYDESAYDDFHPEADKIARIGATYKYEGRVESYAVSPEPLAEVLMKDFPEIESAVRVETATFKECLVGYEDNLISENHLIIADSNFFKVFEFEILSGDQTPLKEPNQVVITRSLAQKLFGDNDPLGEVIELDQYLNVEVTGVMEDPDEHTHLKFTAVISWSSLDFSFDDEWTWAMSYTYARFKQIGDLRSFDDKLSIISDRYIAEEAASLGQEITLLLQPVTSIHLHSDLFEEIAANGNAVNVQILAILAILFLVLFCTNYINSSIVISFSWYKQIGVMKAMGLRRERIFGLFASEALVITWISTVIGIILAIGLLPIFNGWIGKVLTFSVFQPIDYLIFVLVIFAIGILAGSYSAYHLSRLDTSVALHARSSNSRMNNRLQRLFVAFQFVICAAGIISTLVIIDQLNYVQTKDLGYNGDNVLVIRIPNYLTGDALILKEQLNNQPGIQSVALSSHFIGNDVKTAYFVEKGVNGNALDQTLANELLVDYEFLSLFQLELLDGRNFEKDRKVDFDNAIINESAMKHFEWTELPTGRNIRTSYDGANTGKVIGVVKNFHVTSLHNEIEPLVINLFDGDWANFVYVKATDQVAKSDFLETVRNVFEETYQVGLSSEVWLSDMQKELYVEDIRLNKTLIIGSIIILLISGLGLYSLSSFLAIKRKKDFSIRRVFGASRSQVVLYHITDFLKLSLIATVIGWGCAYFIASAWLEGFTYRTDIHFDNFLGTMLLNVVIVVVSVVYHALKVSGMNPATTLKTED